MSRRTNDRDLPEVFSQAEARLIASCLIGFMAALALVALGALIYSANPGCRVSQNAGEMETEAAAMPPAGESPASLNWQARGIRAISLLPLRGSLPFTEVIS